MVFKGAICARHPDLKGRRYTHKTTRRGLCTGCHDNTRPKVVKKEPVPKAAKHERAPAPRRRGEWGAGIYQSRMRAERDQVFSQSVVYCRNCRSGFLKAVVDKLGGRVPSRCCGRPQLESGA